MKALLVLAISLAGLVAAHAAEPAPPGAAAAAGSSGYMVAMIRLGMKHQPSPRMDEACIARIDDAALSAQYLAFFQAHFSAEEIAELDALFGSEAGRKFILDAQQQVEQRKYGVAHPRIELSAQETALIERITATSAWSKYGEMVLANGPQWRKSVGVDYLKLLLACRRDAPAPAPAS